MPDDTLVKTVYIEIVSKKNDENKACILLSEFTC